MDSVKKGQRVGILGGGITGLTAAFYLLRAGADVTVFESRSQVGGLATYFDFGPFWWDRFYHCILTSDRPLLQLIDDLGLSSELRWTETKVGFFADGKLCSMTSTMDFLRFPSLSLWQKLRLGIGVLRTTRVKDGRELEKYLASEWLTKVFGRQNYEKMWGPLLKCKLGACREDASAAFIWATITRLYSTREKDASKKEKLGYVRGGYRTVFLRLLSEIQRMGGKIRTNTPVSKIATGLDGKIELYSGASSQQFDNVIATIPSRPLMDTARDLSSEYKNKLSQIKYLGIVCYALVLKRRLSPYYVTNLTDESLPFTGIIEMSNLISGEETAGRHLVYLPKYTSPSDPLFEASDDETWQLFWTNLQRVFPDLRETDIEQTFLFRERYVQPVPVLHYSDLVPSMRTNLPGLLLANTTQIINSTLNNNAMVRIACQAVELALLDGQKQFPVECAENCAVAEPFVHLG
jgi:protoporphyrinogen oxidase